MSCWMILAGPFPRSLCSNKIDPTGGNIWDKLSRKVGGLTLVI